MWIASFLSLAKVPASSMYALTLGSCWYSNGASAWFTYSEQKNWFTKGQILLVSQIVAQTTKVNSWEFCITKVDILSFVPPNYKYLTFFVEFILILEWGQVNESVFLHIPSLAFFDLYHSIYPSGHALSHIPITFLCILSYYTTTCSPNSSTLAGWPDYAASCYCGVTTKFQ